MAEGKVVKKKGISRRDFIKGTGLAVGGAAISSTVLGVACRPAAAPSTTPTPTPQPGQQVPGPTVIKEVEAKLPKFLINGRPYELAVKGHWTLLDLLREKVGLMGTKVSCDEGVCGFCTVMIDGKAALACMTLAVEVAGREITTIEGLADGKKLHPVQQAFLEEKGFQCGMCTPGQVMGAVAFLKLNPNPSLEDVRYGMSGNMCSCGTFILIQRSVLAAAAKMRGG